jgi:hypothetical protein
MVLFKINNHKINNSIKKKENHHGKLIIEEVQIFNAQNQNDLFVLS